MDSDSSSTIEVTVEAADWLSAVTGPEDLCRRVVSLVVAREAPDLADRAEVGVVLTDDARVRALNAAYRGKDKPTNVLSFPGLDPDEPMTDGPVLLGDVVVAFETTAREAAEGGKPLRDHLTHLLVHGTLHLLGHDHEVEDEAEEMEALEVALLASLGVADPYVAGAST